MSPSDSAAPPAARTAGNVTAVDAALSGWGGGPEVPVSLLEPPSPAALRELVHQLDHSRGAIPRGMGRSYGDAAQLERGLVLSTTRWRGFALDETSGILRADAGATLHQLLAHLLPRGWVLPVVPGTAHVSIGGAIASDIHGKNHGSAGTFGAHVNGIELLASTGEVLWLEPDDELFQATLGGMGLTGVILSATIRLRAVNSGLVSVDTDRTRDIDEALQALSEPGGQHRVAWLDLLGSRAGRGVVTRAEHLQQRGEEAQERRGGLVRTRATVPRSWPSALLAPSAVRSFNELRFRRTKRHTRGHLEGFAQHMFPLDVLGAWPRLYGRSGFVQYQFVVPARAHATLIQVIELLRRRGVPCFLAVLKDMGPSNGAPLSFPIAGWTLALDLPRRATALSEVLAECDQIVIEAGGRVYLSKDARMQSEQTKAMYPELPRWRATRDAADPGCIWRSDMAIRNGLVPHEPRQAAKRT